MPTKTRSWWGWGNVEDAVTGAEREALTKRVAAILPGTDLTVHEPPSIESLELPEPRVAVPDSLAGLASTAPVDRAAHAHGQAFRDVVRNLLGEVRNPPDLVVRPRDEADIVDVLDWASRANVAVIPFGGGTSVVGGVEPRIGNSIGSRGTNGDNRGVDNGFAAAISLDLGALDRVLEIDRTSRAACIQAGVLGPALENQLRGANLTLRHFPQSFEFSTLGGWLATRAGGHFATLYTHIDDLVESMRVVTPTSTSESTEHQAGSGAADTWRSSFLRMPYQRDALAAQSMITETFETACTWDKFDNLKASVTEAANAAIRSVGATGVVTCRFTHVYPDGPAPYFGIYAAGRWGSTVAQWDDIKAAVSEALSDAGGTITHHHAVGRDHRPWYDRQRPDPFANALRAAKSALDPNGILNPGVLI